MEAAYYSNTSKLGKLKLIDFSLNLGTNHEILI